ncbi:MAG: polymer-forming cytoskeletal protein [Anaerolineales bacterium]|nr:MAG: polymer-forming cytoskeletal protein [Anaerolineales bacterium]
MMFKKTPATEATVQPVMERVTSVLGPGINWAGNLGGKGGIRIEGTFEGEISIRGLVVIGETGRLSCKNLRANNVVVAGAVKGNITAEKLEIRSTGRVWGDVVTVAFATEEGAFLRGQVRMEDKVELHLEEKPPASEAEPDSNIIPEKTGLVVTPGPEKKIRKIAKSE